jgi:hypothetical protein
VHGDSELVDRSGVMRPEYSKVPAPVLAVIKLIHSHRYWFVWPVRQDVSIELRSMHTEEQRAV